MKSRKFFVELLKIKKDCQDYFLDSLKMSVILYQFDFQLEHCCSKSIVDILNSAIMTVRGNVDS